MRNSFRACSFCVILLLLIPIANAAPEQWERLHIVELSPTWQYYPGDCRGNFHGPWQKLPDLQTFLAGPPDYCAAALVAVPADLNHGLSILLPGWRSQSPYPPRLEVFLDGVLLRIDEREEPWYQVLPPRPHLYHSVGPITEGVHHLVIHAHSSSVLQHYAIAIDQQGPIWIGTRGAIAMKYRDIARAPIEAEPWSWVLLVMSLMIGLGLAFWTIDSAWNRQADWLLLLIDGVFLAFSAIQILQRLTPDLPEGLYWTVFTLATTSITIFLGLLFARFANLPLSGWLLRMFWILSGVYALSRLGLCIDSPRLFPGPLVSLLLNLTLFLYILLLALVAVKHQRRNWIFVPCILLSTTAAILEVYERRYQSLYDVAMFCFLSALLAFGLNRTMSKLRQSSRLESEVAAGQSVQQTLLPPRLESTSENFHWSVVYRAASHLGGDFYRVQEDADGLWVFLGDVSGKGVAAAIAVSYVLALLDQRIPGSPGETLGWLNGQVQARFSGSFVTALCLQIGRDGRVEYAIAGHPSPYTRRGALPFEARLPLGIDAGVQYPTQEMCLQSGERLVAVSDGLLEAGSTTGKLLGFDEVESLIRQDASLLDLMDVAGNYGQDDDLTLIEVFRVAQ